jgi:hypothetical protein
MARSAIKTLKGPPAATPEISKLRVKPKRVKSGKRAKVRFRLDQDAHVDVTFASKSRKGPAHGGFRGFAGRAGKNKLMLRPKVIGRNPQRFRVDVTAVAYGYRSEPAKTRFRVVRPKG